MFSVLRERNVALLFGGQIISAVGDFMLFLALPFWMYQLTGSAMAKGIMFAALTIPQLIVSPFAGVVVDRVDRKRLMILSDFVRAALMLAYLTVNSADHVWIIYALDFAESSMSQFLRPSVAALVPALVSSEQLAQANALLGASFSVAKLVGPALGGVLITVIGPHGVALFDAASYLFSAAAILAMRLPHTQPVIVQMNAASNKIGGFVAQLRQGAALVVERPILRVVFASLGVLMLSQGVINVLIVVIVKQLWGVGATELGWLTSAEGIGAVIGTVIVGAVAAKIAPRWLIVGGGVITGLILAAMVNQPSIYVAIALIVPVGIMIVAFDVGLTTLMQLGSDDENRGRVASLIHTTMAASQLVSIGLTSLLADRVGAVMMLDFAAVAFIVGGLIAVLTPSLQITPAKAIAQPASY